MMILYLSKKTFLQLGATALCLLLVLSCLWAAPKIAAVAVTGQKPVYAVEREEKLLAISFDASWGAEHTEEILAILDKYEVKTTFFLVNLWIEAYPDMVKAIDQRGHEIGLHSATHPHFTELSPEQMKEELSKNKAAVENLTSQSPDIFRPPYGDYNNTVIATASEMGLTSVQWSVDSQDWKGLSAREITERVLAGAAPGAIVLLHNNGEHTAEALNRFLPALQQEGYRIVPVGELLYPNGYTDGNGILHFGE